MPHDPLAGATWECCCTDAAAVDNPEDLAALPVSWWPAKVPGTAAEVLRQRPGIDSDRWDYDGQDWWFRARFPSVRGRFVLRVAGVATLADLWFNGSHVLHSENMFRSHTLEVTCAEGENILLLRCAALTPALARRRPRPRWRTRVTSHRNLRWIRTSLIGRTPGWTLTPPLVGPWRPIELQPADTPTVLAKRVLARADDDGRRGTVAVELRVSGVLDGPAVLDVAGTTTPLDRTAGPGYTDLRGIAHLEEVEPWWPATHGRQPLYPVTVSIGPSRFRLSPVGFRTVKVDTSGGGFSIEVNGVPIFCRGAVWWPPDPISASSTADDLRGALEMARAANMNMVRVCGLATYETEAFWDQCDELGLLVWQDCMIGFGDPPSDEQFTEEVVSELHDNLAWVGGHPSLAVLCGSLQVYEQAAMTTERSTPPDCPLLDDVIPKVAADLLPGVPYIPSTPYGGEQPFYVNQGVSNYYGVGMYLRDPIDARHSGVRFAAECLFQATPPDPTSVDLYFGGAERACHDPEWKRALHYDPGRTWDKEDLRNYYVRKLLDIDPEMLRYVDADRALDAGRACNAHLISSVFTEWRRVGSACRGGLILGLRDQRPGAGSGLIDSAGRPKATWYAFRRVAAPLAVLLTDEGLQGIAVHVLNDGPEDFSGQVQLQLFAHGALDVANQTRPVTVSSGDGVVFLDAELFGGFRDANYAYRFGPPQHDLVVATLYDAEGKLLSQAFHFPLGLHRPVEPSLGLRAHTRQDASGSWLLEISTERLAQWVVPSVAGYRPSDAWFHLAPRSPRTVTLDQISPDTEQPRGTVRAWNSQAAEPIS